MILLRPLLATLFTFTFAQMGLGQTTIGIHDFETSNASPAMTRSTAATGSPTPNAVTTGNTSSSYSPPSSPFFTSSNSGYQHGGASSGTSTVTHTFSAVDTRNYTGVSVSLRVAAMSKNTANGVEAADYCEIAVSPDNGTTWYQQSRLTGNATNGNKRWAFTGTGAGSRAYQANNTFTTHAPPAGSTQLISGNAAITTLTVTGLPAVQSLRVRVQTRNDSSNEVWVIDDVRVSGTLATTAPTVTTTTPATSITPSSATAGGNITATGGANATIRGVEYSTTNGFANGTGTPVTESGSFGTGTFTRSLTGLSSNTVYYFKAFATNSAGTSYGAQQTFTTTTPSGTITTGGTVTARSTTYGTASTAASFTVSGTGLTGDLTVTPPAGFETSLNEGSGYGATTLITASGTLASTTVYVRLAAATTPGNYSGNITVSGGGASSETLAIPSSTVSAKELTLTGAAVTTKPYDTTTAATITGNLSGIVSPDVVTFTGTGTFAQSDVGTGISLTSAIVLTGANASNYTIAQPTGLTGDITKASQTITFGALPAKLVSDAPFALTATASSGLPVSYMSSNEAVATVSGSTVSIIATGTTVITASQAGNGNYDPATSVDQSLSVTTGPTVLTLGDISVIGFNSNAPDGFAFVTWVDLNPNTVIKFTDNGFLSADSANDTNNGRGGENFATWTNSTGNVIPAGTVVTITDGSPATASLGSVALSLSGISNSGDQIFAYQGPGAGTSTSNSDFGTNLNPSTFTGTILFGLNFGSDWLSTGTPTSNTSYRPSELAAANTSVTLTTSSTSRGQYTGARSGQTLAQFKAAVTDPANWTTATGSGNITLDTTPFTIATPVAASGQFDFAPHDGAATSFAYNGIAIPNVTVSAMTYVGVTPGNNDPNLQGQWPNTGTLNLSGAANAALVGSPNAGAYFEFTLTADAGYILSNPKLRFNVGRELNGPRQFQWRSSVDGFVSPITATRAIDGSDIEIFSNEFRALDQNFFGPDAITSTDYNEVSLTTANRSSVTFRFYAYGMETTNTGARLTRFLNFLLDVTPSPTAVPTAPLVTGIVANNNQLRIAFTPPAGSVTSYEYSIDGGTTWTPTSPAIPSSPLVINGLTNGQTYPIQLRALNANGTGDASPVQNGIPQPNTIVNLNSTDTRTLNGGSYALGAFATSGLPVSFESSNTGVATVSGSTLTIVGPGTTTITASQPGDGDFAAAPIVTQSLTVLPTGWNLIENFESATLGNLDFQNNWTAVIGTAGGTGTTTVTADPSDAGNKVATLSGTHTAASRFMASLSPTETVTLFKRFRIENIDTSAVSSGESHLNMGVSTVPTPTGPGEFTAHSTVTPTVTTPFRLRHTPESAPNNITVTSDVWYSSWYVLDNSTQKFKLYIQGGSQSTPVLAADGTVTDGLWTYRNAGVITAARVYLRTLANHNAPAYIDDIYFAAGEVLNAPVAVPTIATGAVGSITRTSATITGNDVSSDGNSAITERGVVLSTSANPTLADTKVAVSGTTGTFDAGVTGLAPGATYHVRAFATNAIGTTYGADVSFNTPANNLPAFAGMSVSTVKGSAVDILLTKILARSSDADGDTIVLTGVTTPTEEGGTVTLGATAITYTPAANFSGVDTLTFTLGDGIGTIDHTITVTVSEDPLFTSAANGPTITSLEGGTKRIAFFGIPGRTYAIQRSTTMAPGSWTQIAAVTAGANSTVTFDDPSPPEPSAFYRIAFPAE